jgi:putative sigma-54 modulation protein
MKLLETGLQRDARTSWIVSNVEPRPLPADPSIETRLRASLARFQRQVLSVSVRLFDDNGPRGGEDKVLRLRFELEGVGPIQVEGRDSSVPRLVTRMLERTGQVVARRIERTQVKRKRTGLAASPFFV